MEDIFSIVPLGLKRIFLKTIGLKISYKGRIFFCLYGLSLQTSYPDMIL